MICQVASSSASPSRLAARLGLNSVCWTVYTGRLDITIDRYVRYTLSLVFHAEACCKHLRNLTVPLV